MPALFCLAMQPALDAIQARLEPSDRVVAYLDDVYILTRPDRCRAAYDIAVEELRRHCHIEVNLGKLVMWNRSGDAAPAAVAELDSSNHTVWRSDCVAEECGVVVLGAPVGTDAFAAAHGRRACEAEQPFLEQISLLPDAQAAWLLLVYCAGPRANYRLRTTPPHQTVAYAAEHDRLVAETFRRILADA